LDNLFDFYLEYAQTDAYRQEAEASEAQRKARNRPIMREAQKRYRTRYPHFIKMRYFASLHRAELHQRQGGRCYLCGGRMGEDCEVDHVKALINGGANDLTNLRAVHKKCNARKGSKTITSEKSYYRNQ
jgi:5-methylcytosine-specific restriction endonuclease McrA